MRARRPNAVRAVHAADHETRNGAHPAGDLAAPGHARGGRAGQDAPRGPVQVSFHRYRTAGRDRGTMARSQVEGRRAMRIVVASVYVDDQAKALEFYTKVLRFVKKADIPLGPGGRWLTVVSP